MNSEQRYSLRLCAALVGASVLATGCGSSSLPGVLSAAAEEQRWIENFEGSSTPFANPAVNSPPVPACPAETAGTPVCNYHRITPPATVKNVLVAITPVEGAEGDD